MNNKSKISKQFQRIKIIISDVDGVLTDARVIYSKKGEELKKFHMRDGMGINILLRNNIKTCLLTKEKSLIVKKWAKAMNVSKTYSGIVRKENHLTKICKDFSVKPNEIAFIGDDVNDIELMKKVGFSATPSDGVFQVKKMADFVCKSKGGEGAFREICDLILLSKYKHKAKWY